MSKFEHETFEKYPFLSLIQYGGNEYVGIVQNSDEFVLSVYDLSRIHDQEQLHKFLDLGEQWWWESNRMIPINLFLKGEFEEFMYILRTFNIKDCNVVQGPNTSLNDLTKKRSKRRNIQLVKKVK